MNALIVSPYFPPQQAIASLRVHSFARAFADRGDRVTVLTTHKRDDQRGLDADLAGLRVEEIPFRVPGPLERLRASARAPSPPAGGDATPTPHSGRLSAIKDRTGVFSSVRMPDLTGWWIAPAVRAARALAAAAGPWDLVLSSSGPYTAHLAALRVRRLGLARRWLADFRDLWTANHIFPGAFPFTLRESHLERQVLRSLDAATTVSPPLADWLSARVRHDAPVQVIYNGHDRDEPADGPPLAWDAADPRELLYCGALYSRGQDPRPILDAVRTIHPAVRLTAVGSGAAAWRRAAGAAGLNPSDPAGPVRIRPPVPRDELFRMQDEAWALLGLEWHDPAAGVVTGKLPEYLAARPAILLTGGAAAGPMTQLALRAGRGLHLGDSAADIAHRLRELAHLSQGGGPDAFPPELRRDEHVIRDLHRAAQAARLIDIAADLT